MNLKWIKKNFNILWHQKYQMLGALGFCSYIFIVMPILDKNFDFLLYKTIFWSQV